MSLKAIRLNIVPSNKYSMLRDMHMICNTRLHSDTRKQKCSLLHTPTRCSSTRGRLITPHNYVNVHNPIFEDLLCVSTVLEYTDGDHSDRPRAGEWSPSPA